MLSIAFIGSLVIIKTPTKSYKLLGPFLYIVVLCLLLYLSVVGIAERGSINWLSIGGFTFQPSELAKPVMIVTLALLFEKFYKKIRMPNTNHYDMIGFILHVKDSSFVIWKASPMAWGFPINPTKPFAKSVLNVIVQSVVPSP